MKKRDLVMAIIFSIITFGIYGIYWFVCMINDVKEVTQDQSLPSGGKAILLSIITCGIYTIYLYYKLGKVMFEKSITNSDNSVVYLVLSVVGLSIVNFCLIQSELNNHYDKTNNVQPINPQ